MTPRPALATARLTLRPFRTTDAAPLHEILSDPGCMRYWGDRHRTLAETEAFVRATVDAPAETSADFVILRDGAVIGKAGMWQKPEIGFFIHPAHQRRGYAREALDAVIPWLFSAYDLPRLTADVDPGNAASLALLAGLGFVVTHRAERTMQIEGAWCDSVFLALERAAP